MFSMEKREGRRGREERSNHIWSLGFGFWHWALGEVGLARLASLAGAGEAWTSRDWWAVGHGPIMP